jgi:hypothetical protein
LFIQYGIDVRPLSVDDSFISHNENLYVEELFFVPEINDTRSLEHILHSAAHDCDQEHGLLSAISKGCVCVGPGDVSSEKELRQRQSY